MKKVFLFLAAAAITLAACNKTPYIIPVDEGGEEENTGGEEAGFKEETFTVNVVLKDGVSNTYEGVTASMPGKQILNFLGLTEAEFYTGMGSVTGSAYPDPQTSQVNNTVMFGVANANDTDDLKWIPQSSNNIGHWFTKEGSICAWGDDAYFFTENQVEWGSDEADYENMWNFTVGCFPGRTAAGETYKATEVFFYTDDDDVELYAYVQWVITIEEAEQVQLNVVGSETLEFSAPYYDDYTHTALDFNAGAIQSAIGISFEEADVYGVNADGSFSLAPAKNFWFSVAGDVSAWGDGAGICINDDGGTNDWAWCMYPDAGLVGQTLKGGIAFVNPNTLNAYVVNVVVTVSDKDYWNNEVTISVGGDAVETYPDLTELAQYLGFEDVNGLYGALCDGSVYPVGVNADGSLYLNEDGTPNYSQTAWYDAEWGVTARGVFFSMEGNCTTWASGSDNFYTTMYWFEDEEEGVIEIDVTPFDVTDDNLGTYYFRWGFTNGEKTGYVQLVVTLESSIPWAEYTIDGGTVTVKMTPNNTYKGLIIDLDDTVIAEALGVSDLAAGVNDASVTVVGLNADGTVAMDGDNYMNSGEGPFGHWFNKSGDVCWWGTDDCAICSNIKVGADVYVAMCQFPENCVAGENYTVKQRFLAGDNSYDVTYNIAIVESL